MKTFSIRHFILAVLLLCLGRSFAQQKHTLSGTIKDKNNGELIIGATVQIVQNSAYSAVTNEYGFYSISIPDGQYSIICSYIGFEQQKQNISLDKNIRIDWLLKTAQANTLSEVVVSRTKKDKNLNEAQMGIETLNMKKIEKPSSCCLGLKALEMEALVSVFEAGLPTKTLFY
jgi:hypothetical protein